MNSNLLYDSCDFVCELELECFKKRLKQLQYTYKNKDNRKKVQVISLKGRQNNKVLIM